MLLMLAHGDGAVFGPFSTITFVLRFAQTFFLILPTLIAGFLIAGALRTTRGRAFLSVCFATPVAGLIRATLLGLIAPVGALGALPIASEMLKAKVRPGHVMAFLVGSALFMPWSFGHLADSVGVVNALVIIIAAIITAMLVGALTGVGAPSSQVKNLDDTEQGSSQLIFVLRAAARHAARSVWVYVFMSLAASSAFAAILEAASIESHLNESARTTMIELSVPLALANIDSDIAVTFAGEFWRIGLLSGGMLVAIMIGAGWCIGTLAWSVHRLRLRGIFGNLVWLACVLGLAAIMHGALSPIRPGEADSHGFDMLTKPANVDLKYTWSLVGERTLELANSNLPALISLVGLMIFGALERGRSREKITEPENAQPYPDASSTIQRKSPRVTLSILTMLLLVINTYSFYPHPEELASRMRLESGNLADAISVMASSAEGDERFESGQARALNALDRIDSAGSRVRVAGTIRGLNDDMPDHSLLDLSQQIRSKVSVNETDGLRTIALKLHRTISSVYE